jgi:hypothetical protein
MTNVFIEPKASILESKVTSPFGEGTFPARASAEVILREMALCCQAMTDRRSRTL